MTDNQNTSSDTVGSTEGIQGADTVAGTDGIDTNHGDDDRGSDSSKLEPSDDQPDTFPRSYVEELRSENARYRTRAQQADTLAERLHIELVRTTGRLADPSDLAFNPDHLDDPDALAAAVDDLLERKPHLASRRPSGDVGQGTVSTGGIDLAALLRNRA